MQILIAEDDKASRVMLESMLSKWGYEVIAVEDGQEAINALTEEEGPQFAILDWMMPAPDGLEVCRRIREHTKRDPSEGHDALSPASASHSFHRYVYIIVLTAKSEKKDMVEGLDAGADDYITKPFNADELQARIRAGQRIVSLHNELLQAQREMEKLARQDYLTSSLNRRAIIERIKEEISRSSREKASFSLAMLDIDHFKQVNDEYGHSIGDGVLIECINRLQSVVRDYDMLGRFGGEEFLVFIPGTESSQAEEICERIRSAVATTPFEVLGTSISITVSLGCTTWKQDLSTDDLIRLADNALYRAKEKGRNRVECDTPES